MKYEENVSSVRTPTPVLHLIMAGRGELLPLPAKENFPDG
jgi:hypothetical protein